MDSLEFDRITGLMMNFAENEELSKAEKGDASAQYSLGSMYNVAGQYDKALYWLSLAAKKGHVDAQVVLGTMYENGQGVECNLKQAVYWYQQAALQGDAEAVSFVEDLTNRGLI